MDGGKVKCECGKYYANITLHQKSCVAHSKHIQAASEAFVKASKKKNKGVHGILDNIKAKIRRKAKQDIAYERRDIRSTLGENTYRSRESSTGSQNDTAESESRLQVGEHIGEVPRSPSPLPSAQNVPTQTHVALPPTRSGRARVAPKALADFVPNVRARDAWTEPLSRLVPPPPPAPASALPHLPSSSSQPSTESLVSAPPISDIDASDSSTWYQTTPNAFGLYRRYPTKPQRDPADEGTADDFVDSRNIEPLHIDARGRAPGAELRSPGRSWSRFLSLRIERDKGVVWYAPFSSVTSFRISWWRNTGSSTKSREEIMRLVDGMIRPGFKLEDLLNYSITREENALRAALLDPELLTSDGWRRCSISIPLPLEGVGHAGGEQHAPMLHIDGVLYRDLEPIMEDIMKGPMCAYYQFVPYETWVKRADGSEERVYCEAFDTDCLLHEHLEVQKLPRQPEDPPDLERVVIAFGAYSDETQLGTFGHTSMWPIYVYPLNLSKYVRSKPENYAAHHIAYIPSLPDRIQDAYKSRYGKAASSDILRLCKLQVLHALWLRILNERAMNAYTNGIRHVCGDTVERRGFLRFLWYACDFKEKTALACVRSGGHCACHRCLILTAYIHLMGTRQDDQRRENHPREDTPEVWNKIEIARKAIFEHGSPVKGENVEILLKPTSLVPIRSAFSKRLAPYGVNHYDLFVVDFMHEFELGVWKEIFKHLLRVLHALGGDRIQELNQRFRQVPTFGNGVIRRFGHNVCRLQKMAARDYENILQCILPCIDGLCAVQGQFRGLEKSTKDMLWYLLMWHGLAKLREHTDRTLRLLGFVRRALGKAVRAFKRICDDIPTDKMPGEEAARGRRDISAIQKGKRPTRDADAKSSCPKRVLLNLVRPKWHLMGHYEADIMGHGGTDGFSTQTPESEHKRIKRKFAMSNKRDVEESVAMGQQMERALQAMALHDRDSTYEFIDEDPIPEQGKQTAEDNDGMDDEDADLPRMRFEDHYQISMSTRERDDILDLVKEKDRCKDPAFADYMINLKNYALARRDGRACNGEEYEYSSKERFHVDFAWGRQYNHRTMRINYTTYDRRRDQDSINPRTRSDVMVVAPDEEDVPDDEKRPYWYAQVIGIHHVEVKYRDPETMVWGKPQKLDFLHVRWYGRDCEDVGGFAERRLPHIGYVPSNVPGAFGFLDPALVVRAAHLIPVFSFGRTSDLLPGLTHARRDGGLDDWRIKAVNMFVDRDMLMRYLGGGIGHVGLEDIIDAAKMEETITGHAHFDPEDDTTDFESSTAQELSAEALQEDGVDLEAYADEDEPEPETDLSEDGETW